MDFIGLFQALLGLGGGLFGASNDASSQRRAAGEIARASDAAADATMIESERGSADIRNTALTSANALEESGNNALQRILEAGNRAGDLVGAAGSEGRANIMSALSGLDSYAGAGQDALARIMAGLGEGGEFSKGFEFDNNLMNDQGVQFRIDQGRKALENSAAARGLIGGNTVRATEQFAQGVASEEFNNAFNRSLTSFKTNRQAALDPLMALVGVGQNATNTQIAGTQAAENLFTQSQQAAGNFFTDAARTGSAAQLGAVQGAGQMRNDAERTAAMLRAAATQNAGQFRIGAGEARAGGIVGAANAFRSGLGSGVRGLQDILDLFR
ncbi:MAG: hypothetical protein VKL39_01875 [Leptolyngbyaceae bacterium]|nr:hypothetical protein [Leptolyngbyaceae bacterium]